MGCVAKSSVCEVCDQLPKGAAFFGGGGGLCTFGPHFSRHGDLGSAPLEGPRLFSFLGLYLQSASSDTIEAFVRTDSDRSRVQKSALIASFQGTRRNKDRPLTRRSLLGATTISCFHVRTCGI